MAMTAAERQKRYRERNGRNAGRRRINLLVAEPVATKLDELAKKHGVFKQVMLEQVIGEYGALLCNGMPAAQESSEEAAARLLRLVGGNREKALALLQIEVERSIDGDVRSGSGGSRPCGESRRGRPLKKSASVSPDQSCNEDGAVKPDCCNPSAEQLMFTF